MSDFGDYNDQAAGYLVSEHDVSSGGKSDRMLVSQPAARIKDITPDLLPEYQNVWGGVDMGKEENKGAKDWNNGDKGTVEEKEEEEEESIYSNDENNNKEEVVNEEAIDERESADKDIDRGTETKDPDTVEPRMTQTGNKDEINRKTDGNSADDSRHTGRVNKAGVRDSRNNFQALGGDSIQVRGWFVIRRAWKVAKDMFGRLGDLMTRGRHLLKEVANSTKTAEISVASQQMYTKLKDKSCVNVGSRSGSQAEGDCQPVLGHGKEVISGHSYDVVKAASNPVVSQVVPLTVVDRQDVLGGVSQGDVSQNSSKMLTRGNNQSGSKTYKQGASSDSSSNIANQEGNEQLSQVATQAYPHPRSKQPVPQDDRRKDIFKAGTMILNPREDNPKPLRLRRSQRASPKSRSSGQVLQPESGADSRETSPRQRDRREAVPGTYTDLQDRGPWLYPPAGTTGRVSFKR